MDEYLLSLKDVHKGFPSHDGGPRLEILKGIQLHLKSGETVAIVGPSGSGKSTVLHLLGTLDRPDRGRVIFEGTDITALDDLQLAALRNRRIGFIFQSHQLLPHCTVLENVVVPALAMAASVPRATLDRARRLLDRVGLGKRLSHRPGQLSGGECQRVAVVRGLIHQPSLLLADEPTGALDFESAASLTQLLLELNREEKVTLVVVTHALDLARQMQRVLELKHGGLQPVAR